MPYSQNWFNHSPITTAENVQDVEFCISYISGTHEKLTEVHQQMERFYLKDLYFVIPCGPAGHISISNMRRRNFGTGLKPNVAWWRHQMETFPRYWPFVPGIHRSPVNSPHKGQWRGALKFSLICVWINGWVNNGVGGDLSLFLNLCWFIIREWYN